MVTEECYILYMLILNHHKKVSIEGGTEMF